MPNLSSLVKVETKMEISTYGDHIDMNLKLNDWWYSKLHSFYKVPKFINKTKFPS